jgi:hypothetical protein
MRVIWLLPALRMPRRRNGCERSTVLHSTTSKCSLVSDECNELSNGGVKGILASYPLGGTLT